MSKSPYDHRDHEDLVSLVHKAREAMSKERKAEIREYAEQGNLRNHLQMPPKDPDSQPTLTLQELSDIGVNDHGIQSINVGSVEGLLFGDFGLISTTKKRTPYFKLMNMPTVVYRRSGGSDLKYPANASGRHRNFAVQIIGTAAGVDHETLMANRLWVVEQVAESVTEHTACMKASNAIKGGARKPTKLESFSYDFSADEIELNTFTDFILTYPDAKVTVANYPALFGVGTCLACQESVQRQYQSVDLFTVSTMAFNMLFVDMRKYNREPIKSIITQEPEKFKSGIVAIEKQLPKILKGETEKLNSHQVPLAKRVSQELSNVLADSWSLQPLIHATEEEYIEQNINKLEKRVRNYNEKLDKIRNQDTDVA